MSILIKYGMPEDAVSICPLSPHFSVAAVHKVIGIILFASVEILVNYLIYV